MKAVLDDFVTVANAHYNVVKTLKRLVCVLTGCTNKKIISTKRPMLPTVLYLKGCISLLHLICIHKVGTLRKLLYLKCEKEEFCVCCCERIYSEIMHSFKFFLAWLKSISYTSRCVWLNSIRLIQVYLSLLWCFHT